MPGVSVSWECKDKKKMRFVNSAPMCYLCQNNDYYDETAYQQDFPVHDFHFLTTCQALCEVTFKIRHTPEYHPATLEWKKPQEFIVHSKEKIHGVAPGQFCVIYDANHHRCLGSGEITVS